MWIAGNGLTFADAQTDQPGSTLLIRTVGGRLVVAADLMPHRSQVLTYVRDLERRGYLPPDPPLTREEWQSWPIQPPMRDALWMALGQGLPAGLAAERAGIARVSLQRAIKRIGWASEEA